MIAINLLGAETQAAASVAAAYPERRFVFVSGERFLDGWDLPNVAVIQSEPSEWRRTDADIVLCPRWLPHRQDHALSVVLPKLALRFGESVVTGQSSPAKQGRWIAKGDRWHKPDAPHSGSAETLKGIDDPGDCGLIYQPLLTFARRLAVVGVREAEGRVALGAFAIEQERFFRQAIIQAAETVNDPDVVDLALAMLDELGHRGYFTLNFLRTSEGVRLTSLRPVPLAVFGTLRRAGLDLLAPQHSVARAMAGFRFVGWPHYSSYGAMAQ